MPVAERWAYLDHSAVAPLPRVAAETLAEFARQAASDGDLHWPQWESATQSLRRGLAEWIGASPAEIGLIPNTTFGINVIAEGLDWRPGDNVVIPAGEFPSNRFPWLNQRDLGVEVREIPQPEGPLDVQGLAAAMDDRTRVLAFSWVAYDSGVRADVEELTQIAHKRGAIVLLDAIQGMGVLPINVGHTRVDCLTADGHKWMLGPEGAGVMYLAPSLLDRLRCRTVGWGSVRESHNFTSAPFELKQAAARYEGGSANMCGLLAFHASLQLFWRVQETFGAAAIEDRVVALAEQLAAQLRGAGAATRYPWVEGDVPQSQKSGIVNFTVPDVPPAEVRKAALEAGCVVSCRGAGTRASIHAYNDESDIERLVSVVRRLARAD